MLTYYVTTQEIEEKQLNTEELITSINCSCGQSYGYINELCNYQIIVCNSCHESADNQERFF